MDNTKHFYARDRQAGQKWLEVNHEISQSLWLAYDKGPEAKKRLPYEDIVEVALCYGWIDSRPGKFSDTQTKLYISRRKPKSVWSKSNKIRVRKFVENGLIQLSGYAAINIAKKKWVMAGTR